MEACDREACTPSLSAAPSSKPTEAQKASCQPVCRPWASALLHGADGVHTSGDLSQTSHWRDSRRLPAREPVTQLELQGVSLLWGFYKVLRNPRGAPSPPRSVPSPTGSSGPWAPTGLPHPALCWPQVRPPLPPQAGTGSSGSQRQIPQVAEAQQQWGSGLHAPSPWGSLTFIHVCKSVQCPSVCVCVCICRSMCVHPSGCGQRVCVWVHTCVRVPVCTHMCICSCVCLCSCPHSRA